MELIREKRIENFYSAFNEKNYKDMNSIYANELTFHDPVFRDLNYLQTTKMWEMLCNAATDLQIECKDIKTIDNGVKCTWIANYTFSRTGNKVTNVISAYFEFNSENLVTRHVDDFDLYQWVKQAFGTLGLMFGRFNFFKNKIHHTSIYQLNKFMKKSAT